MGVVGVYQASELSNQTDVSFEVLALHFNLWILPRKTLRAITNFRFFKNFIDVGLRITVKSGRFSSLDLHLPGIEGEAGQAVDFFDLEEAVLNETVNDLIFGRPVRSVNGRIEYSRGGSDISERVVGIKSIKIIEAGQRFRIEMRSPVDGGNGEEHIYIRFRYECRHAEDIIISKGWGFAKKGSVVDVRLNDTRETLWFKPGNKPENMVIPKEFNAFVIHPANFVRIAQSPEIHYARILEPQAWQDYLLSCGKYDSSAKMIINQWKFECDSQPVQARFFAHLHREFGFAILVTYLLGVLSPTLIGWLMDFASKIFS